MCCWLPSGLPARTLHIVSWADIGLLRCALTASGRLMPITGYVGPAPRITTPTGITGTGSSMNCCLLRGDGPWRWAAAKAESPETSGRAGYRVVGVDTSHTLLNYARLEDTASSFVRGRRGRPALS